MIAPAIIVALTCGDAILLAKSANSPWKHYGLVAGYVEVGETLEQAVDYAKSIYGTDDIIWYNEQGGRRSHAAASYAMLSGDRSAALPNPYTAADVDAAA